MIDRLSFDEYGCLLALMAKSRSVDKFTRVAAIALDKNGRVLGAAYNGLKPGMKMPEWMTLEENRPRKSMLFLHAESNLCALLKKDECHTICLTISPCIACCQNIAALNIQKVVYIKEYEKCDKFKDFLAFHDIEYRQLSLVEKKRIQEYIITTSNFEELN